MTRRITGLFAGAAIALTALGGAAAYAQSPAPDGKPAFAREHRRATPEERADKLATVLQLRPNQKPAALAYVNALRPSGERMRRPDAARPTTTPERLARMEERMTERQAKMRTRIAATRTFYAQLDPAQQKAFDALPQHHGRKGKGMRHGGSWRGHGPDRSAQTPLGA